MGDDVVAFVGTRLFLDVEWADASGNELVSIALVDERGDRRFYAEIDPLPAHPTDFARYSVYPLLERGWSAMQGVDLARNLKRFIDEVEGPVVMHDHQQDWILFCSALSGALSTSDVGVKHTLLCREELIPYLERYFDDRPRAAGFRHHARIDAEALRWAYLAQQTRQT